MARINFLPPWVETNLQPAFYDLESGTCLQQTARMYDKVNQLVRSVNDQNETIADYIHQFIDLKDYCEDYFDNLDVQEEINNKLDEMAEDGTLQEIITAYIQANVAWTFDTVADMKLASNLVDGSYARTLGFHSINDGGGATYYITNTGTANEKDVISVGTLYANLVNTSIITPEQLGAYGNGVTDDTDILQYAVDNYVSVRLQKKYLITDTIEIHDKTNGFFGGDTPFRTETLNKANARVALYCSGMTNKAAISLCGCLNYNVQNIGIFPATDATTDGCAIGIYCGRSESHTSSQWNDITGVAIAIGNNHSLNNGVGTIGIYNNAAEEFEISNCSIRTNVGIVHTDRDCLDLKSLGNNYNYANATCTVISHSHISMVCETAYILSHVTSINFDNIFYANVDNYENPIIFKANFTHSVGTFWNQIHVYTFHAEQNVTNLKLLDFTSCTANHHVDYCDFNFYSNNSSANTYINNNSTYTGIYTSTKFNVRDGQSSSNVLLDFTTGAFQNVSRCYFYGLNPVKLTNARSCYVASNNSESTHLGTYGGSPSESPAFPFAVSSRSIGTSWAIPVATDVLSGSICLCTDPSSSVALWIYKNNEWKPVNISS